jgi:putative transposase
MPKKAHTEEQIVAVLRQGEAGEKVADICRKVGISEGDLLRLEETICRFGH